MSKVPRSIFDNVSHRESLVISVQSSSYQRHRTLIIAAVEI